MNNIKRLYTQLRQITAISAVTVLLACNADNDIVDNKRNPDIGVDMSKPMFLSVGDLVQSEIGGSRAVDYNLQNGSFADKATIGMFVMHEYRYRIKNMTTLSETQTGYLNLPFRIDNEGNLVLDKEKITDKWVDTYNKKHPDLKSSEPQLYYPYRVNWDGEDDYKVSAIAYAPYDDKRTWDDLDTKKNGFKFNVSLTQCTADSVLRSDLLLGFPANEALFYAEHEKSIPFKFKHALTKIELELHIVKSEYTVCDSVIVRLLDAPSKATLKFKPNQDYTKTEYTTTSTGTNHIKIAAEKRPFDKFNIVKNAKGEDEIVMNISGIIVPSAYNAKLPMGFAVTLKNREVYYPNPVFVGKTTYTGTFEAGKIIKYRMTIYGTEDYSINVPDEGEDDWIVGSHH